MDKLMLSVLALEITISMALGLGPTLSKPNDHRVALYRPSLLATGRTFRTDAVAPGCGSSFLLPDGSTAGSVCPSSCPFQKPDMAQVCHVRCISHDECFAGGPSVVGYPNTEKMYCEACLVIGCVKCSTSATKCGECAPGYTLYSGSCLEDTRYSWYVLYIVLVIVAILVVGWFVRLTMKKNLGLHSHIREADSTRSNSKLRREEGTHGFHALTTDVCEVEVSGLAIMLHFRFQRWWIIWTGIILVVSGALSYVFYKQASNAALENEIPGQASNACLNRNKGEEEAMLATRMYFVWMTFAAYVLTTVFCIIFAYNQRKKYVEQEMEETNMADFGLLAKGFPETSGGKEVEDEYTKYFKSCFGESNVVGVSICWDFLDQADEVDERLQDEIDAMCAHAYKDDEGNPLAHEHYRKKKPGSEHEFEDKEGEVNPDRWQIDNLEELKQQRETKEEKTGDGEEKQDTKDMLLSMKTTQFCFVVFETEGDLAKALEKYPEGTPIDKKYKGEHEIKLQHYICKPATVLWTGFSLDRHERWVRICMGYGAMLLMIVLWAILFYGPVILYARAYWNVPGQREGSMVSAMLVGFLVTLGNNLVYAAAAYIAEKSRFCNFDSQEEFNTVLYTIAIFINSIIDLYIYVYAVSQGYLEDAMHGVGGSAMASNPNMQEIMYNTLFAYLVPGCLVGPFVAEILIYVFPLYLGRFMVRSTPKNEMNRLDAESMVVPPYFDMTRYGDLINNILLVIICFFLTNVNLWYVFLWLLIGNVYIYYWDKYRILRFTQRTDYSTDSMEQTAQYLTIFPCAMLAGAFAFKAYGGQAMVAKWERDEFLAFNMVWITVIGAMVGHGILHFLFLKYIFPNFMPKIVEQQDKNESWQAMSEMYACSWFNSNPVHCLRSRHILEHKPPFVYHVYGKEYLQVKNPKIKQFYEAGQFEPESGLGDDAKAMIKAQKDRALNQANHLKDATLSMKDKAAGLGSNLMHKLKKQPDGSQESADPEKKKADT